MQKLMLAFLLTFAIGLTRVNAEDSWYDLQEAAALSRLEFKNCEVFIKTWTLTTPDDPEKAELTKETTLSVHALLDYENKRCIWLQRSENRDVKGDKISPSISYVIYHDGKGLASPSIYKSNGDIDEGFFQFTASNDVWRVELAGSGQDGTRSNSDPQKMCDDHLLFLRNASAKADASIKMQSRVFPDGSRVFSSERASDGFNFNARYEPQFVYPIRESASLKADGIEKMQLKREAEFELVKGFTLGKSVSIQKPYFMNGGVSGTLPSTQLRTIEYKWVQFNEDHLEWPDEGQIMSSPTKMLTFITPDK